MLTIFFFFFNPAGSVDEPVVVSDSDSDLVINWWIEALGLYDSDKEIPYSSKFSWHNIFVNFVI